MDRISESPSTCIEGAPTTKEHSSLNQPDVSSDSLVSLSDDVQVLLRGTGTTSSATICTAELSERALDRTAREHSESSRMLRISNPKVPVSIVDITAALSRHSGTSPFTVFVHTPQSGSAQCAPDVLRVPLPTSESVVCLVCTEDIAGLRSKFMVQAYDPLLFLRIDLDLCCSVDPGPKIEFQDLNTLECYDHRPQILLEEYEVQLATDEHAYPEISKIVISNPSGWTIPPSVLSLCEESLAISMKLYHTSLAPDSRNEISIPKGMFTLMNVNDSSNFVLQPSVKMFSRNFPHQSTIHQPFSIRYPLVIQHIYRPKPQESGPNYSQKCFVLLENISELEPCADDFTIELTCTDSSAINCSLIGFFQFQDEVRDYPESADSNLCSKFSPGSSFLASFQISYYSSDYEAIPLSSELQFKVSLSWKGCLTEQIVPSWKWRLVPPYSSLGKFDVLLVTQMPFTSSTEIHTWIRVFRLLGLSYTFWDITEYGVLDTESTKFNRNFTFVIWPHFRKFLSHPLISTKILRPSTLKDLLLYKEIDSNSGGILFLDCFPKDLDYLVFDLSSPIVPKNSPKDFGEVSWFRKNPSDIPTTTITEKAVETLKKTSVKNQSNLTEENLVLIKKKVRSRRSVENLGKFYHSYGSYEVYRSFIPADSNLYCSKITEIETFSESVLFSICLIMMPIRRRLNLLLSHPERIPRPLVLCILYSFVELMELEEISIEYLLTMCQELPFNPLLWTVVQVAISIFQNRCRSLSELRSILLSDSNSRLFANLLDTLTRKLLEEFIAFTEIELPMIKRFVPEKYFKGPKCTQPVIRFLNSESSQRSILRSQTATTSSSSI